MEFSFINKETNNEINLKSDKSLIIVYGKNGSGKTTLSRNDYFDKEFVFNEDFIFSNVYNINNTGASQTTMTKENFSGLWLGEDIVKIRKEIDMLLRLEKMAKDEHQNVVKKLNDFFYNNQILVKVEEKITSLKDEKYIFNLDKYDEEKKTYKCKYIYITDIKNDEDFKEKLKYLRKNDIYNMLIQKIRNNELLSELILLEDNKYIQKLNEKIKTLIDQKEMIDKIETIYKKDNITPDLVSKIKEWYDLHKDKTKCLFCGNEDIKQAMEKWKSIFTNEYIDSKNKIIESLISNMKYFSIIVEEKTFEEVDKDIIQAITDLSKYVNGMIENFRNNEFREFCFEIKISKKEAIERHELINNLTNYVLNKNKDILGFYYNVLIFINKAKKEKLLLCDKLMEEQGTIIANSINEKFEKFGLNKNIKIVVDKYSTPHKFTYSIKEHENINELSDGQKHKLALAIFMNYLEKKDLNDKIIVIDDPVVSLDIASYILFKKYLLNDLIENHFKDTTKMIILTHDITYLYIQLSNIFDKQELRSITDLFKLNGKKIEPIPLDYIKTDDITFFRDAIDHLTNLTELRILNAILLKIFRLEIDLKLRFYGKSLTDGNEIEELPYDESTRKKLKEYDDHILKTTRRDHPTDCDIKKSIIYLKETSDIIGFKDFITDEHIKNIDRIVNDQIEGSIEYELFYVIETIQKFLKTPNNEDFKHYIEHTRNSYTRNLIGLGLEDYYN